MKELASNGAEITLQAASRFYGSWQEVRQVYGVRINVPGVPTSDTSATMHNLIQEARVETLMVGYAVHNTKPLFGRLAKRMMGDADIHVVFCLDISRKHGDTSLDSEIVGRFAEEFRANHSPWRPLPELYYDPRSLAQNAEDHSSLYAKCVVSDS